MEEYREMVKVYQEAGGNPEIFKNSEVAHLVVHKNKVLGTHLVEGLVLNTEETADGVKINLKVEEGIRIPYPVHLCFGVLPKEGKQEIGINLVLKKGASISILAHCVFPNAVKVQHIMEAQILLEDGAVFHYDEIHYHGVTGGVEVIPKTEMRIGKNAHLATNFSLVKGRAGRINIDYLAKVDENGIIEMIAKICGYGDDRIKIRERGELIGRAAKGLLKSRVAVRERAESEVISELLASAPDARGHVDCVEIVQGEAKAKAIPLVNVLHEKAQVTHEAAIGRVNQRELETLMARGLREEEAVDVIIGGMLK